MTSDQRRNVMASRKLAQQRVLRIMQEQSTTPADQRPPVSATTMKTPAFNEPGNSSRNTLPKSADS
jgi:hypothetical protein